MATPTPTPEPGLLGLIDQSPTLYGIVGGLAVVAVVALLSRAPKLKPITKPSGELSHGLLDAREVWECGDLRKCSLVPLLELGQTCGLGTRHGLEVGVDGVQDRPRLTRHSAGLSGRSAARP